MDDKTRETIEKMNEIMVDAKIQMCNAASILLTMFFAMMAQEKIEIEAVKKVIAPYLKKYEEWEANKVNNERI